MTLRTSFLLAALVSTFFVQVSCKTMGDVREEKQMDNLKTSLKQAETDRADFQMVTEELKMELVRLSTRIEESENNRQTEKEEHNQQLESLTQRIEALENSNRPVAAQTPQETKPPPVNFNTGKTYYDRRDFENAIEVLKEVAKKPDDAEDGKKAQYLLAQSYFANKDYALAAIEFGKYKKAFPSDALESSATFRQAQCFKNMGKNKEAKLFFQEVLDKHPKSSMAAKAKDELKRIK